MIFFTIILEIVLFSLAAVSFFIADENYSILAGILALILVIGSIAAPIAVGELHGYVNYIESNDRDKVRITAITQEQTWLKPYYHIEVEYLTNTPTQSGVVTNYNIEKDNFYCYITDKELVEKIQNNLYKEVWLISGYKGGYETYKDFGNKLAKDIELIEE